MNWLEKTEVYKDKFIEDLRGLVAIASIRDMDSATVNAPFGTGCRKALDYMLELGRKEGFAVADIDGYAGVISYGEGEESVGVLAHLDVVPLGEGWTKDPLGGEIENGYIFGRGTLDDKGPAMTGFYALKMMKDHGIVPKKKIMLILGCDEETGMSCMDYYVKHAQVPDMGFTPDANFPVIYGEKGLLQVKLCGKTNTVITSMHAGDRPNIVIGSATLCVNGWKAEHAGLFDFYLRSNGLQGSVTVNDAVATLHIDGVSAHAAMPYNGVNAALHLLNFIGATFHDKFAADTYAMLKDWQGKSLGIDKEGARMGFLTMNTGIVHVENGAAEITIDIRYPNDTDSATIMAGFHKTAAALQYELDVIMAEDTKPLYVDPESVLVKTLSEVYRTYSKDMLTPNLTIGGGTYAKKFPNFVAFGPEFPDHDAPEDMFVGGCHQRDEGACVEKLLLAMAIYTAALEKLAA